MLETKRTAEQIVSRVWHLVLAHLFANISDRDENLLFFDKLRVSYLGECLTSSFRIVALFSSEKVFEKILEREFIEYFSSV